MPASIALRLSACLSFMLLGGATIVAAQVPTRASEPRLAPAREPVAQVPSQPTVEPTAPAQPVAAEAPAAAPPAEPAPVSPAPAPSGVTTLPATPAPTTSSSSQAATAGRSYATGMYGLSLDGINVGLLQSVQGGVAVGEVVVERAGPDNMAKKHLAGIKYEDLSFDVGLDSRPVLDWIAASWKKVTRKNGSVQLADYSGTVRGERQFTSALITGTTFPAMDASSKDAGNLTLTLAPEFVRETAGSGRLTPEPGRSQKSWRPANFRLEMDNLDATRVSRIASFTVGQKVNESPVGELRDYQKEPSATEFPNLKITLAEASSQSWAKWHDDFVIKGNSEDAQEKNGAIVLLDYTRTKEMARVNLFNCGIFRFGAEPSAANKERLSLVTADVYCERMELAVAK